MIVRRALGTVLAAALLAIAVGACATKIADAHLGTFTSISGNQVVRELSDEDRKRICVDAKIFLATALTDGEQHALRCQLAVVSGARGSLSLSCNDVFSRCMADGTFAPSVSPPDFTLCGRPNDGTDGCNVTVATLDACLHANANAALAWLNLESRVCEGEPIPGATCLLNTPCAPIVQNAMAILALSVP